MNVPIVVKSLRMQIGTFFLKFFSTEVIDLDHGAYADTFNRPVICET
jgi:hypothetical protein